MEKLKEGVTGFTAISEKLVTKKMDVFYNPVMKLNRDLTLLVLATMENPRIGLPMEASGIRAARILKELVTPGITSPEEIFVNDISKTAIETAKKNVIRNIGDYPKEKIFFTTEEATKFLRAKNFDYIDVDPFGTPCPFLDSAVRSVKRGGIIGVTATDTSALAGTYPRATARKYWAIPSRTWVMHEIGLRILIRRVQLVAASYGKALTPIISVSSDHYYRIFFRCEKSFSDVKEILAQHKHVSVDAKSYSVSVSNSSDDPGPLWIGRLHDIDTVRLMRDAAEKMEGIERSCRLLEIIEDECSINTLGFLDLHLLAGKAKIDPPRRDEFLERLGKHGCRTHISPTGFKTDLAAREIEKVLNDNCRCTVPLCRD